MPRYPGFVGPSNTSQSPIADIQDTVNLYIELLESIGAKTQAALYPFPGLASLFSVAQGPVRAIAFQDGRGFVVIGYVFYEFFADWSVTSRGNVAVNSNPATITFNDHGAREVFVTSGGEGYLLNLDTNAFTNPVHSVDVGGFIDGYFVALDATLSVFKSSSLEDGTTWPSNMQAARQGAGDGWIGMAVKNREVWLFGSQTSEVWVNVGSIPFPFQMIQQGLIQKGSAAAFSVAQLEDTFMWLEANEQGHGMVVRSNGYEGQRVSTHAVEFAIQGYGTLSDAVGYSYQDQGHTFYVLNFPTANATWVYDITTNLWTKRLFWDTTNAQWLAHRGICHAFAFGQHLIGDRATGTVYNQSVTNFTDAGGTTLRRVRRAPHLFNEGKNVNYHRLQLDMQVGVGLATGQGSDPQVMLRVSKDGGLTWGTERWAAAGPRGAYAQRVVWRRLPMARDVVFEVSFSDPVPFRINDAWIEFTPGSA